MESHDESKDVFDFTELNDAAPRIFVQEKYVRGFHNDPIIYVSDDMLSNEILFQINTIPKKLFSEKLRSKYIR